MTFDNDTPDNSEPGDHDDELDDELDAELAEFPLDTEDALETVRSLRALLTSARIQIASGEDPTQMLGDDEATLRDVFIDDEDEIDEALELLDRYLRYTEDPLVDAWRNTLFCETAIYAIECGFDADDFEHLEADELLSEVVTAWKMAEAALECAHSFHTHEPDRPLSLVERLRAVTLDYARLCGAELSAGLYDTIGREVRADSLLYALAHLDAATHAREIVAGTVDTEVRRMHINRVNRLQRTGMGALRRAANDTEMDRIASAAFAAFTLTRSTTAESVAEGDRALTLGYQLMCALSEPESQLQLAHREAELHLGRLAPLAGVDALTHDPATAQPRTDRVAALLDAGMLRIEAGRLFGALPPLQEAFRLALREGDDEMLLSVASPLMYALAETTERICAENFLRETTAHASVQRDLEIGAAGLMTAHDVALDSVQAALRYGRPGFALHLLIDAAYTRGRLHSIAGVRTYSFERLEQTALSLRDGGLADWAALCGAQISDLQNERGDQELAQAHADAALNAFQESGLGWRITAAATEWMQEHWGVQSLAAINETLEGWRARLHGTNWAIDGTLFEHMLIGSSVAALAERCAAQPRLTRSNSADIVRDDGTTPAERQELAALRAQALLLRAETMSAMGFGPAMGSTFRKARLAFRDAGDVFGELECELIARNTLGDIDPQEFDAGREL